MNSLESRLTLHLFLFRKLVREDFLPCWIGSEVFQPGLPPTMSSEYACALYLNPARGQNYSTPV